MKSSDELYQESLERQLEQQAKEEGITLEELMARIEEEKAEEQREREREEADRYYESLLKDED